MPSPLQLPTSEEMLYLLDKETMKNSNFGNASQKTKKMSLSQTPAIQNTMSSLAPEYLPGLI
jgi:hypothetical protein